MAQSPRTVIIAGLLVATTCLGTSAALADVKSGVDAWTAGDYATAVRAWSGPAAQNDPDAQFNLAQAYRLGRGVDIDLAQAEALYAKAAAQGHVKAADNYGLLLFQRGARTEALPYIEAASSRGDPRAQYLMGIAHFNGDLAGKDWRRAYALLTLANSAGLPQARGALAQMDEHIPLADRQAAQALAVNLKTQSDARRASELAAVDLALGSDLPTGSVVASHSRPGSVSLTAMQSEVGADFIPTTAQPVRASTPDPKSSPATLQGQAAGPPARLAHASTGEWNIQLGVFSIPGNADRLWSSLSRRSDLSGHQKVLQKGGKFTTLLAGGFATKAEASATCAALKRSGQECIVRR